MQSDLTALFLKLRQVAYSSDTRPSGFAHEGLALPDYYRTTSSQGRRKETESGAALINIHNVDMAAPLFDLAKFFSAIFSHLSCRYGRGSSQAIQCTLGDFTVIVTANGCGCFATTTPIGRYSSNYMYLQTPLSYALPTECFYHLT